MNFVRLRLHRQAQLKLKRRLTRGTRVTSAWQWPSDAIDMKWFWDYPYYARLHPNLRCLAEFFFLIVLSIQLENELLIVLLAS